jgi:hypothetical protein
MRTSTYLLVGTVAMASWWLASRDAHQTSLSNRQQAAPGYYFQDATLTETDATGHTILTLTTRHAEQDPQNRTIHLREITVDYHSAADAEWRLRADRGSMPVGADVLTLRGNVELYAIGERTTGAIVHTDLLSLDRIHHIASTANPAVIEWPPHKMSARGFKLDLTRRTLALENAVHGTFRR